MLLRLGGVLVLLAAAGAGCQSFGLAGRAAPVPRGRTQLAVIAGAASWRVLPPGFREGVEAAPIIELGVRRGLTDRMDVGGRVWPLGGHADAKVALHARQPGGRFIASLAPGLGYALVLGSGTNDPFRVASAALPVPLGVRSARGHEIVVAPTVVYQLWQGAGAGSHGSHGHLVFAGGTAGVVFKVGRTTALMPEVTVLPRLWTRNNVADGLGGSFIARVGVALVLGDHDHGAGSP